MKKILDQRALKIIGLVLICIVIGGSVGYGIYSWQSSNNQKLASLDASFVAYESTKLPGGITNVRTGNIESLKEIYSRQFQFTDKDGNVFLVTAIEVGSSWVNIGVEDITPVKQSSATPSTPAPTVVAPSSTPKSTTAPK